jgi:D-threo-aldose 1-dehydrogenase
LETVSLGNTGRSTSRLGFGCSSVMGALGRRDSLAMLEAAWDAGIRHFDVAPMYGYGEAESCLGEFLGRHPGQITVTTKFGIPANAGGTLARIARSALRPVVHRFPELKRLAPNASTVAAPTSPPRVETSAPAKPPNPIFNVEEARQSLHKSLNALKTDHIDVWLLHDVTSNDLTDDNLLHFLETSVKSGVLGTFGAGTDRSSIDVLYARHPKYCPTLQYEWSVFDPIPVHTGAFRIHHRALTNNFRSLHADMLTEKARCSRWSDLVGADLSNPDLLAKLLLKAALLLNPQSIILFSSKNPHHIQANVALTSDDSLSASAMALYRIVQTEVTSAVPEKTELGSGV